MNNEIFCISQQSNKQSMNRNQLVIKVLNLHAHFLMIHVGYGTSSSVIKDFFKSKLKFLPIFLLTLL